MVRYSTILFVVGIASGRVGGQNLSIDADPFLPLDADGGRALVLSIHKPDVCVRTRFAHMLLTRPADCDVVALFNVQSPGALGLAEARKFERKIDAMVRHESAAIRRKHVVPFATKPTYAVLQRLGYPARSIEAFSEPQRTTSVLSKMVWVVWGARQLYREIWFVENDVYVPCPWSRVLDSWNGARERYAMVATNCGRIAKTWSHSTNRGCNFCEDPSAVRCMIGLSAYTQGVLQEANAALLGGGLGLVGFHEALLPTVCKQLAAGGRPCNITDLRAARTHAHTHENVTQISRPIFVWKPDGLPLLERRALEGAIAFESSLHEATTPKIGLRDIVRRQEAEFQCSREAFVGGGGSGSASSPPLLIFHPAKTLSCRVAYANRNTAGSFTGNAGMPSAEELQSSQ
jgi:hypothetical protein